MLNRFFKIRIVTSCFLCLTISVNGSCQIAINKQQAINIAEKFVADNGYCLLPAKKNKLAYELFDGYQESRDSVLKHRHNRLRSKAFCISEDDKKWNVGFLLTSVNPDSLDATSINSNLPGRAVMVSKDGKEIKLAHKTPLFSLFNKL